MTRECGCEGNAALRPRSTNLKAPRKLPVLKPKKSCSDEAGVSESETNTRVAFQHTGASAAKRHPTAADGPAVPLLEAVAEIATQADSTHDQPSPFDAPFRWGPLAASSPDPAWGMSQCEYEIVCTFEVCRQDLNAACTLLEDSSRKAVHDSDQLAQVRFDWSTSQAQAAEHEHLASVYSFKRSPKKCARKGISWNQQEAFTKSAHFAELARRDWGRVRRLEASCVKLRASHEASEKLLHEARKAFMAAEQAFRQANDCLSLQLRWDAVSLGLLPKICLL